ncbi:MAG: tetratricopeptide repeat protein [candidate division Zixibacteria bacterium]|nr:tetratricopeptide repeat protein [candidate division Zixibacteria bacterium]
MAKKGRRQKQGIDQRNQGRSTKGKWKAVVGTLALLVSVVALVFQVLFEKPTNTTVYNFYGNVPTNIDTLQQIEIPPQSDSVENVISDSLKAGYSVEAELLLKVSNVEFRKNNYEKSLDYSKVALHEARRKYDTLYQLNALGNIALIHYMTGNVDNAVQEQAEVLRLSYLTYDTLNIIGALLSLAVMEIDGGHYSQAYDSLKKSYRLAEIRVDYVGMGKSLGNMSTIEKNRGNLDSAVSLIRKSAGLFREENDLLNEARSLSNLGKLYAMAGRIDSAYYYTELAFEGNKISKNKELDASLHVNLASIYRSKKKLYLALRELKLAESTFIEIRSAFGLASVYANYGGIYSEMGMFDSGVVYYNKSVEKFTKLNAPRDLANQLRNLALVYFFKEDYRQSSHHYRMARDLYAALNLIDEVESIDRMLAEIENRIASQK